jgi:Flp pilus assembly protein TadD
VGVYTALTARDPENPLLNFRLADALLRSGHPREAVAHYQRVVASRPRSADPFVGLATAFAQTNRMEQARETLERALDVDPRNGQVHYNLGEIARARGDLSAARTSYQAALADPVTRDRASARLDAIR